MYSTCKNVIGDAPVSGKGAVCGKYLQYPDSTGKRRAEGGMRLHGQYKRSRPGKPLVSIVTTVFNRETVLERAMCSVFAQTYDNIEYILVDALSSDGTLDKIFKYDDVVDYYVSEPDGGMYEGINKGLSLATGDYILILNSDDWYNGDAVETLVNAVQTTDVEYVSALASEVDVHGQFLRDIPPMPFGENIRMRMPLRHELMLVPSSMYDAVGGYDPSYRIIGDLKCTQRLFENSQAFEQLPQYLMCFRRDGMASDLTDGLIKERQRLLAENFSFLDSREVKTLASEYRGNESKYKSLYQKYRHRPKLIGGIRAFLRMQGVDPDQWVK